MEFTVGGMAYTFNIVRWGRRGFSRFLGCFFEHTPRDPEQFGTYSEDEEGQPSINMTTTQKLNAVIQACKDIMECTNMIILEHQKSVLDYAVWYLEKHGSWEIYSKYITMLACNCIVDTHFIVPGVSFKVITFPGSAWNG